LVVDVLAVLDASPYRIRQNLREALHLGAGVGGVNESGTLDDGLESRHGYPQRLADASSLVLLSNEADVLREMNAFLVGFE
jgi:hypothetical protein